MPVGPGRSAGVGRVAPVQQTEPPTADLALLRRYEPVLRFTEGEHFLPVAVGPYLRRCSLWSVRSPRPAGPVAAAGELTPEGLAAAGRLHRDVALHLQFVQRPLTAGEVRRWWREDRPRIRGTARLAAVGVLARLVDVLVRLSLVVRGRVPGGLVAAAHRLSVPDLTEAGSHWYGRVVRDGGYTMLQYWFFYPFNDWRSTCYGVNDHEADWETAAVYLVGDDAAELRPAWVAASSHDHAGAELRRRWDDPGLHRDGDHPVLYPGAGSHAHAFVPGDHVVAVELAPLRRVLRALHRLHRRVPWFTDPPTGGFSLPFVEYARGDGPAVGPGTERPWLAELIDDDTGWVRDYRGLWGLDTGDTLGGERAPAGPRYERDGTVRTSWAAPLAWAELDTVEPGDGAQALGGRIVAIGVRLAEIDGALATGRAEARALRVVGRSVDRHQDTRTPPADRAAALEHRARELAELAAERTRLVDERAAHEAWLGSPPASEPPDAHLRHVPRPHPAPDDRRARLLRIWAAVSLPVLLLGLGVLAARPGPGVLLGFGAFLLLFAVVEAVLRRRVLLLLSVLGVVATTALVIVGLILALSLGATLLLAGLLGLGGLGLLVVNLRELRP